MNGIGQTIADFLPYGVVRRVASRRARQRRARLVAERSQQLRAVLGRDDMAGLPRLNIGCGSHREPGWLNADADPGAELQIAVRAGEPLPFVDGELEMVFSEHFLEHLSYDDGVHFLRESARVLRRDGVFRVSCPDLDVILGLLRPGDKDWKALAGVYESIGDFAPGVLDVPERVVNWAFYGHEHRYLWSFRQLRSVLEASGFGGVERVRFGVSRYAGAAIERRRPEAFYSLIVEAVKQ